MGCASSKQVEVSINDVYCPAPSSFSLLDVYAIEEPWLKVEDDTQKQNPTNMPTSILEKLKAIEDAPRAWDEVSKALEDLKPTLHNPAPPSPNPTPVPEPSPPVQGTLPEKEPPNKSSSFHTLEELDAKLKKIGSSQSELKKTKSTRTELKKIESLKPELQTGLVPQKQTLQEGTYKRVKENIFIVRDKLEREKEGKKSFTKRDPLSDYPEKCPPGGANTVVLYTTSLGGVRRTYEDCNKVRSILELRQVVFDERDVSLHAGFLNELRELVGEEEGLSVPRLFVKGRYVGGMDEVVGLNEVGKLGRIMSWAGVERGVGRLGCQGCGGARFVPCLECSGSCKVVMGDTKERCNQCNENGLVHCPVCL